MLVFENRVVLKRLGHGSYTGASSRFSSATDSNTAKEMSATEIPVFIMTDYRIS